MSRHNIIPCKHKVVNPPRLHTHLSLSAGRNMLLVGVDGPKVPCEEILVKHLGNRMYNVSYQLKEKGEYILVVKWGDEHIPGSPYHITV